MINVSDRTITLMGLGLLGRGINVAKFLLDNGAKLIITDLKTAEQLAPAIAQLAAYENQIMYVFERHRIQDFVETDLVVKAAGVPLDNKYIAAARESNILVKMDASWAVTELPPSVITIGVTGTKGKSSVTHLLEHILKLANKSVYVGGNVKGRATLPILNTIKSGDYLLMELDSWQLQGFHDEKISPHIAVFTNFMPDHLNYYIGMSGYFHDKAAIYEYQGPSDRLVLSPSSYQAIREYGQEKPAARTAIVKPSILMKDWEFTQPGDHNRLNAAQAYQVAKFLNIEDKTIKQALETFPGVPGRLEKVGEVSGVVFYNDTNASIPEATIASIGAVKELEPVIIVGGNSKRFPNFDHLAKTINNHCSAAVLLPGGVADQIKSALTVNQVEADSMSAAVELAHDFAKDLESKAVLMSPAGTSFGLFKNEYDRGDQFNAAVKSL